MIELPPEPARIGPLTAGSIARFHLPLVVNAWLMALVGPVLNVALGRAPEPQRELAAFWLAFSVLLVAQSASLVMQQACAAALRREVAARTTAWTGAWIGATGSVLVWCIAATALGDGLFSALLPAPSPASALARSALVVLSPVPLFVALRGVAAGLAVAESRTGMVALASAARVGVLVLLTVAVISGRAGAGAISAAWTLVAAAAADMLVAGALALRVRAGRPADAPMRRAPERGVREFLRIALPLAAASVVWTVVRPLVGAVLGHLADAELAQAAFGVVLPMLMMSCAPLWGFVEVAIVLPRNERDVRALVHFAVGTSAAFSLVILGVVCTPLRDPLLRAAFALTPRLEAAVVPALAMLALEPLVLSARAIAHGLLLRAGRGALVLALSPVKLVGMALAGAAVVRLAPQANGAVVALALIVGGDLIDVTGFSIAVLRTGAHRPGETSSRAPKDAEFIREAA